MKLVFQAIFLTHIAAVAWTSSSLLVAFLAGITAYLYYNLWSTQNATLDW
jgi:hypothetical protein